jgi:hypothetical protein
MERHQNISGASWESGSQVFCGLGNLRMNANAPIGQPLPCRAYPKPGLALKVCNGVGNKRPFDLLCKKVWLEPKPSTTYMLNDGQLSWLYIFFDDRVQQPWLNVLLPTWNDMSSSWSTQFAEWWHGLLKKSGAAEGSCCFTIYHPLHFALGVLQPSLRTNVSRAHQLIKTIHPGSY